MASPGDQRPGLRGAFNAPHTDVHAVSSAGGGRSGVGACDTTHRGGSIGRTWNPSGGNTSHLQGLRLSSILTSEMRKTIAKTSGELVCTSDGAAQPVAVFVGDFSCTAMHWDMVLRAMESTRALGTHAGWVCLLAWRACLFGSSRVANPGMTRAWWSAPLPKNFKYFYIGSSYSVLTFLLVLTFL